MPTLQNHSFTSPLRYPGGKGCLTNFVKLVMTNNHLVGGQYVEIYAGGASIAWALLQEQYAERVHVNDLDRNVMALWQSVLEETDDLCRMIWETPVTMEMWYRQRAIQDNPATYSRLEVGFSTFFLNRANRSGILKGGVIGGKGQTGRWKMDCRFHKEDLVRRVERIAQLRDRVHLYNLDAAQFIEFVLPKLPHEALVYLDPPYFRKGQDLYQNHYGLTDHVHIAKLVSTAIVQPWIVSYDASPEIMALYGAHPYIRYNISYSAQDRYAGSELIFHSHELVMPRVANPAKVPRPKSMKLLL